MSRVQKAKGEVLLQFCDGARRTEDSNAEGRYKQQVYFPKVKTKQIILKQNSAQVSGVIQLRLATRCRSNELITDQDPAPAQAKPPKSGARQRAAVLLSTRPGVQTK